MSPEDRPSFATRYAAAWSGSDPVKCGTGRAVHLSGYERWTIGADGLITKSDGHFDNDEYQRRLTGESPANR